MIWMSQALKKGSNMSRRLLLFLSPFLVILTVFVGVGIAQQIFPSRTTVSNKSVVYFVDASQVESYISVEKITKTFNAVLAIGSASDEVVDGIIIHKSALPTVDKNWLRSSYLNGVTVAGIDITGFEMADLVGNKCIAMDNFANQTPNYIVVSLTAMGDESSEISKAIDHYLQTCSDKETEGAEGIKGKVEINARRSSDSLVSDGYFDQFSYVFNSHINPSN